MSVYSDWSDTRLVGHGSNPSRFTSDTFLQGAFLTFFCLFRWPFLFLKRNMPSVSRNACWKFACDLYTLWSLSETDNICQGKWNTQHFLSFVGERHQWRSVALSNLLTRSFGFPHCRDRRRKWQFSIRVGLKINLDSSEMTVIIDVFHYLI